MRRPAFLSLVLIATLALAGCSDQSSESPAEPTLEPYDSTGELSACSPLGVLAQIIVLVPKRVLLDAVKARFAQIPGRITSGNRRTAQEKALALVDWILKAYYQGQLVGGESAATQAKVLKLITSIYCLVKLPPPNFPAGALGDDGAVAVVTPNSDETLVITGNLQAAVNVPAGAAPQATTIVITRLPDSPEPLLTSLSQFPPFYLYTSTPEVEFDEEVITGICVRDFETLPEDLRLAHNVGTVFGQIEILPPAEVGFLGCDPEPEGFGFFGGGARGGLAWAQRLLLPAPLHASAALLTSGVGGTTRKFSPFGVVDPNSNPAVHDYNPDAATFGSLAAPPGETVTSPSVRILSNDEDPVAERPVAGVSVVFAVTSGGGLINGGTGPVTVTTNANGVASLSSWQLGGSPGINTVTATPQTIEGEEQTDSDPYQPAANFSPVSLTFTATAAGDIDYEDTGWRYLVSTVSTTPPSRVFPVSITDFDDPGYEDIGWLTGDAGFGQNGGDNCSLNLSAQATSWPINSDIVLRKPFVVPPGTSSATVRVAIDNDIKVFVNGTDVTSTAAGPVAGGFKTHEGCPTLNSFVFTATVSDDGVNWLAIQARDRGGSSYVDADVVPVPP